MELSFKDLKKREVVNVADGKNYGSITDIVLAFPNGVMTGIVVKAGGGKCLSRLFDKSEMFIGVKKINKIGNDVILVNLNCGDICVPNTPANEKKKKPCSPCDILGQGIDDSGYDEL